MRGYSVLATILVACMASSAIADPGTTDNDAGSGADAGNVRSAAWSVAYDVTYSGRVRGPDIDWYAASIASSATSCVRLTGASETGSYFGLGVENADGTTTAPILIGQGAQATGGIAGKTPLTSTLRVARAPDGDGPGHYSFRVERAGIPAEGDGGTGSDVGEGPHALAVEPGCIGGHLSAIDSLDMRDVYAVSVAAGQVVTYSLASNTGGHTLSLLDSAGEAIGPALESGGLATVSAPTSGTYLLSAQRTTAIGDVGYIAGVVVGPDPSTCRPYCLG